MGPDGPRGKTSIIPIVFGSAKHASDMCPAFRTSSGEVSWLTCPAFLHKSWYTLPIALPKVVSCESRDLLQWNLPKSQPLTINVYFPSRRTTACSTHGWHATAEICYKLYNQACNQTVSSCSMFFSTSTVISRVCPHWSLGR